MGVKEVTHGQTREARQEHQQRREEDLQELSAQAEDLAEAVPSDPGRSGRERTDDRHAGGAAGHWGGGAAHNKAPRRNPRSSISAPMRSCCDATSRPEDRDPLAGHGIHRGRGHGVLADLSRIRRRDGPARRRSAWRLIADYARQFTQITETAAAATGRQGGRARSQAPGRQGRVLRACQEGAVASNRAALPAGRAAAAADHRPPDLGGAADRRVTRGRPWIFDAPLWSRRCSCWPRSSSLSADRVRLRSGKVIAGIFIGGDSKSVRLLLERRADLGGPARPRPSPSSSRTQGPGGGAVRRGVAAPAAAPRPVAVTVPAGSRINVRLTQAIDVDTSKAGMTFKAVVDDPVR